MSLPNQPSANQPAPTPAAVHGADVYNGLTPAQIEQFLQELASDVPEAVSLVTNILGIFNASPPTPGD